MHRFLDRHVADEFRHLADRAIRAFATVDRALSALDRNASPKIVADWLALNI